MGKQKKVSITIKSAIKASVALRYLNEFSLERKEKRILKAAKIEIDQKLKDVGQKITW